VKARVVKVLRAADNRPVASVLILSALLFAGLLVWAWRSKAPVLIANADPTDRVTL
jgi:hypothetical protein